MGLEDLIGEIVVGGLVAAGGFVADLLVHKKTGKHIHEHMFEWWRRMSDRFQEWLHAHSHLGIRRIGLVLLDAIDGAVCRTKAIADWVTLVGVAEDKHGEVHRAVEEEVPVDEALRQFPTLEEQPVLVLEMQA